MLTNVSEELRLRAPRTGGGVGLGSSANKGSELLVPGYPGNGWTYFKTTGEITTRNDWR